MPSYHLYKDGNIINIIHAQQPFIDMLIKTKQIDSAQNVNKNPVSLTRNEEGFFVLHEPIEIIPQSEQPKQLTAEDVMKEVETLKEKLKVQEALAKQQLSDVSSAILAIKGFMMEIPTISKELQELKESINNNFTS